MWTPSRIRLALEVAAFATGCALTIHSALTEGSIARLPFYLALMGILPAGALDRLRRNGNGSGT